MTGTWHPICASDAVRDGASAVRFAACVGGEQVSCFVIRFNGQVHAYLNRCSHVAMELDWQPGQVFDTDAQWLVCATHGAHFEPDSGRCAGGPCTGRGGLRSLRVLERDGTVYWQPDDYVEALLPERP
jgi:nitrite reductase/ring-hydroxylating ferredoxin subunit